MKMPDKISVSVSLWWLVDLVKKLIERKKDEDSYRDRQRDKEVDSK
jgi:hypothetical protein